MFLLLFITAARFVFCLSVIMNSTDLLTYYILLCEETIPSLIIWCCSNYCSLVVIDSDSHCAINIARNNSRFPRLCKTCVCHADNMM